MLTPRLAATMALITGNTLADIGTDHAYIPIEAIKQGFVGRAIACDIKKGPLAIARSNVEKNGLQAKIELRLGSGITPVSAGETETVVIAGMGGILISGILDADSEKSHSFKEIILQPMNAQSELRKYLSEHGFRIVKEDLAVEGFKVYNIMRVINGCGDKYSEFESHIPTVLRSHKYFDVFLAKKKREFTKILTGLERASERDEQLIDYYKQLMDNLTDIESGDKL